MPLKTYSLLVMQRPLEVLTASSTVDSLLEVFYSCRPFSTNIYICIIFFVLLRDSYWASSILNAVMRPSVDIMFRIHSPSLVAVCWFISFL